MLKPARSHEGPEGSLISLNIGPVTQSDQFSLCTLWVAKDLNLLQADSEDFQTGLIWSFTYSTSHFVGFVMLKLILLSQDGFIPK